jgi:hypothetical protein
LQMSPLIGKKKKTEIDREEKPLQQEVQMPPKEAESHEELTPTIWFSRLTNLGDTQSTLHSLPDLDIQLCVGSSLVRFVKKGLSKPTISEERSLRPDVTIRISDKAWADLEKIRSLEEFGSMYRKYAKNPSHDEFVKVSINKESLLSDSGILRSKLFKNLLLV